MQRRGYILSVVVMCVDILFFAFGGGLIAVLAGIYASGPGEWLARVKCRAILCQPEMGNRHMKLNNCFLRVREKAAGENRPLPDAVKVYLVPGETMNAYCFGRKSIGVTEGALNLDNQTVEAMIAHEIGHLVSGDSVLNMILMVNCLGLLAILAVYQFALVAVIYLFLIIGSLIGTCTFSFMSCFVTSKVTGAIRRIMDAIKTVVLQACRLLVAGLGRESEFRADHYAASLGYAFYLKRFLERFAPDTVADGQSLFDVFYDTHPSTASRIERLTQRNQN